MKGLLRTAGLILLSMGIFTVVMLFISIVRPETPILPISAEKKATIVPVVITAIGFFFLLLLTGWSQGPNRNPYATSAAFWFGMVLTWSVMYRFLGTGNLLLNTKEAQYWLWCGTASIAAFWCIVLYVIGTPQKHRVGELRQLFSVKSLAIVFTLVGFLVYVLVLYGIVQGLGNLDEPSQLPNVRDITGSWSLLSYQTVEWLLMLLAFLGLSFVSDLHKVVWEMVVAIAFATLFVLALSAYQYEYLEMIHNTANNATTIIEAAGFGGFAAIMAIEIVKVFAPEQAH